MFTFRRSLIKSHSYDFDSGKNDEDAIKNNRKNYSHTVNIFGQEVFWKRGRHYTCEELEPYRLVGDKEVDRILELNSSSSMSKSSTIESFQNIYEKIKKHKDISSQQGNDHISFSSSSETELAIYDFYRHYHDHIPSWVHWDQIQRGIDVFITFAPCAGHALFYLSLVPGFSIPKIAKVLEQIKSNLVPPSTNKQVFTRLIDTGAFVANVMIPTSDSIDEDEIISSSSLRPGFKGWRMALQVRLIHAKVRRSILNDCKKSKKNNWDILEYGIPINQEDMAATLCAFSVNILMGIEFIAGKELSSQEQEDYLALWRYIGWLLGIDSDERESDFVPSINIARINSTSSSSVVKLEPLDPCGIRFSSSIDNDSSIIHARASLESFVFHLMKPDKSSCSIAKHLLGFSSNKDEPGTSLSYLYRCLMCRRFIGNQLADSLDLPRLTFFSSTMGSSSTRSERSSKVTFKPLIAYMLTSIVLIILRVYTLLTIYSTWFRKKAYQRHLNLLLKYDEAWSNKKGNANVRRISKGDRTSNNASDSNSSSTSSPHSGCPFTLAISPKKQDSERKTVNYQDKLKRK